MSTGLAERTLATPAVTSDQVDLITRTVAVGATPDELKLYLYDCARQGVHPLDKLIHFTKRKGKYTPITSIDFMRTRAADTNEYAGSDDAKFENNTLGSPRVDPPLSATVTVWRMVQGQRCSFTATARWSEYKPAENDFMWQKMPHTMLAKCAEALALRKGFPRQLAGLYAKEEMDQAGESQGGYTVTRDTTKGDVTGHAVAQIQEPSVIERVATPPGPPPSPDGLLRVERVDHKPTKNKNVTKFVVVLSDGREVSTINTPMGTLAEQLCQDGDSVEVETKTTKWGEDLVSLHRAQPIDYSDTGDEAHGGFTNDDIPF